MGHHAAAVLALCLGVSMFATAATATSVGGLPEDTCAPFTDCQGGVACFADPCGVGICPARPDAVCLASYHESATYRGTRVGPCGAVWTDPATGDVVGCGAADPVETADPESLNPVAGCAGNVRCRADPCAAPWPASCPNRLPPGAVCFPNYCTGQSYRGRPLQACAALWVDPATRELVACGDEEEGGKGGDEPSDPLSCPPGAPTAMCLLDPCSLQPATCAAHPAATCRTPYCALTVRGRRVAPCTAVWVDAATQDIVDCDAPADICPPDAPAVQCLVDPCSAAAGASCPAAPPGSTCTPVYCAGATAGGAQLPPCSALWREPGGAVVANCSAVEDGAVTGSDVITHIDDCPPGAPTAKCAADGCAAACPAHPGAACTIKSCPATYRGVRLAMCQAVWTDPATGDIVDCRAPAPIPAPACELCTTVYAPVCASDRQTYPNRCSAECAGLKVAKPGKCEHCNGDECAVGKRNDLCQLAAPRPQCWAKKYECRLPATDTPQAGKVLGRCLLKRAAAGGRRQLM